MTADTFVFLPTDDTYKVNLRVASSMTHKPRRKSAVSLQIDGKTWLHGDCVQLMEYRSGGDRIRLGEKGGERRFDIERVTEVRVWIG